MSDAHMALAGVVALAWVLYRRDAGNAWPVPEVLRVWLPFMLDAEREHDLPAGLLARVAWQESRGDPDALSPAGAVGLMQIVPRWHPDAIPTDPVHSIHYAAGYLADLYRQFGNWPDALAAYNWGPGNVSKNIARAGTALDGAPTETRNYVQQITADVAELAA